MKKATHLILPLLLLTLAFGCSPDTDGKPEKPKVEYVVGGIYSVEDEGDMNGEGGVSVYTGAYSIVKILKVENETLHVRLYRNEFKERPLTIDPATLILGTLDDDETPGIGHLPLSRETFDFWKPFLITTEAVSEDELEGYLVWKDSGAGHY